MADGRRLEKIFRILLETFGPREWWPGESPLEVMVGAVLTQNTSWKNVEKAISALKMRGMLNIRALHETGEEGLGEVIRSSGFYNLKARRLKNLIRLVVERFGGTIEGMAAAPLSELRPLLLSINGLGPETVDSILLYALEKPVFVVDAYTRRFLLNHGLNESSDYHEIQRHFEERLPYELYLYNEFHALIVILAQTWCRKVPLCEVCPLKADLRR